SRVPIRLPERRQGRGPGRVPTGLRRTAGTGAWRLSRGLLRLRHTASELRHRSFRQDAFTHSDVPQAHTGADRAAVRHRSLADRTGHRVDGAAAARRRSALHRRGEHFGVTTRQTDRIPVRPAAKGVPDMTASDDRVLFDVDPDKRIATITLNSPGQRNSY